MKTRIVAKLSDLLRQETSPKTLALSIAIGMGLSILPLLGVATALCTIAAILLRPNLREVQVANFEVLPLQMALVLPFVRLGEKMLGAISFPLYSPQLLAMLHRRHRRNLFFCATLLDFFSDRAPTYAGKGLCDSCLTLISHRRF